MFWNVLPQSATFYYRDISATFTYDVDITIIPLGFNQKDDVGEEFMMNDMEEEYECICRLKIVQSECSLESLEFNIDLQPLGMIVKATFFMTYLYQA